MYAWNVSNMFVVCILPLKSARSWPDARQKAMHISRNVNQIGVYITNRRHAIDVANEAEAHE